VFRGKKKAAQLRKLSRAASSALQNIRATRVIGGESFGCGCAALGGLRFQIFFENFAARFPEKEIGGKPIDIR
jgi:hypothetical protein